MGGQTSGYFIDVFIKRLEKFQKTQVFTDNDILSNSSKNKKAKELGVKIITEDEFIEQFAQ